MSGVGLQKSSFEVRETKVNDDDFMISNFSVLYLRLLDQVVEFYYTQDVLNNNTKDQLTSVNDDVADMMNCIQKLHFSEHVEK